MRKAIGMVVLAGLLLGGCGSVEKNEKTETDQKETNQQETDQKENRGIAYFQIQSTLKLVEDEQGKAFVFTLKNQNDRPEQLEFSSSMQYDYKLMNEKGEVLKQRSEGMAFAQVMKTVTLKQAQTVVYREDYDKVIEGLPKGSYTIEFFSTAKSRNIRSNLTFDVE